MRITIARRILGLLVLGFMAIPAYGETLNVCSSGCTYDNVQDAIDSITDSSVTNVYTISIDAGVFQSDDSITTDGKDYINFVGRGAGVTVLQASPAWYAGVASSLTGPDFFDLTDSKNISVMNLSIDARTADPGDVSTSMQFAGAKTDPEAAGKIVFEGCDIQGIHYGMWDSTSLSGGGVIEIFNSRIRGAQYAVYAYDDRWHFFSSELRLMDEGGTSGTIGSATALYVYGSETTLWGSHVHAESSQPNKSYAVNGLWSLIGKVAALGSTLHVKMTTTSVGAANRPMTAAFIQGGTATFDGTEFLYENTGGALNQGRLLGLRVNTGGTVNLAGCTFRDAGGSGGTSRTDLLTPNIVTTLALRLAGTRIDSVTTLSGSAVPAAVIRAIARRSTQRGVAMFNDSDSVSVTLPVAFPDALYSVGISVSAGETVWVTSKSGSGFTINSSNPDSTASVDWVVTRCTFDSSSCEL
jgi:hypothetical protein